MLNPQTGERGQMIFAGVDWAETHHDVHDLPRNGRASP